MKAEMDIDNNKIWSCTLELEESDKNIYEFEDKDKFVQDTAVSKPPYTSKFFGMNPKIPDNILEIAGQAAAKVILKDIKLSKNIQEMSPACRACQDVIKSACLKLTSL